MREFGVGTYSFGMASPLDTAGKLRAAADMGCAGIELLESDLQLTDEQLRAALGEAGIALWSIHARVTDPADFTALCARLAPLGLRIVVMPGLAFCDEEETLQAAKTLDTLGEIAARFGLRLCYHNHRSEFFAPAGKPLHEILVENTDAQTVFIQLDVGWATAAGVDVPAYLAKYPGRFASIHVKECSRVLGADRPRSAKEPPFQPPKGGFTAEMAARMRESNSGQCALGAPESLIDWAAVDRALEKQGTEPLWIIEREYDYHPGDMLRCLREDAAWLREHIARA